VCWGERQKRKGVICLGSEFLLFALKAGTIIVVTFLVVISKANVEIEIRLNPLKVKIKKKVVR